ncbi:hypothetical protein [Sporomusa termitida]|uniref:Uncharacterized protein n=1 Tax=Sporomusa termitida TaxID=2377 RepID=A0A517DYT7_9FIRM|nr:hypothetical protein [Sporomusa termitida]QDR82514.1 hypothetical protein SPTER_39420 [Sporomusa termitida]
MKKRYKKTEKWWLGLTVLFFTLYNIPGLPAYGNANAALWHGALTIIPLWIVVYGGMAVLSRQRRLRQITPQPDGAIVSNTDSSSREGM